MAKTKIEVDVTYRCYLEIDTDSPIVQEYTGVEDIVQHLAAYKFMVLPVIDNGVEIHEMVVEEINFI